MATMQHGAGALPSVTTCPDQFWDELMTTSPLEDVLVARMAAAKVGVGVSPPASCEVSAPLLAECASESFSVPPAATIEQRCVHLPVAKNDMKMQIVGQASALDPQIRHAPPHGMLTCTPVAVSFFLKIETLLIILECPIASPGRT